MRDRKYWKAQAKSDLRGNWGLAILGMLAAPLVNLIGSSAATRIFSGSSLASWGLAQVFVFIVSLISMIISTGYIYMLLNLARGKEYRMTDVFSMFKRGSDGILVAGLVIALIDTVLQIPFYYLALTTNPAANTVEALAEWVQPLMLTLLGSIAVGTVIKLPLAMAFYFLADEPQMGGIAALKKSVQMMKGHMLSYLMLQISFLPLIILGFFMMYIGLLWVMPYMQVSCMEFYRDLIGEHAPKESVAETEKRLSEMIQREDDYNSEA